MTPFETTAAQIFQDKRATPGTRELVLAVAYALSLAPSTDSTLTTVRRTLGSKRTGQLIAADAPRYEPPREAQGWGPSNAPACEAPRVRPYTPRPRKPHDDGTTPLRKHPEPIVHADVSYVPREDFRNREGVCGASSRHRVLEKDPRTGWVTAHWFCARHRAHADRVAGQVAAGNESAPEPIPNVGGLLPSYFKADWERVYRYYTPGWVPPSYGLAADDWPTAVEAPRRGRLRLIV